MEKLTDALRALRDAQDDQLPKSVGCRPEYLHGQDVARDEFIEALDAILARCGEETVETLIFPAIGNPMWAAGAPLGVSGPHPRRRHVIEIKEEEA